MVLQDILERRASKELKDYREKQDILALQEFRVL